ncbi:unnamed protein product [Penicillium nalgiovense]|nr:unnamed protein product [Penicillium nalgiovense]
MVRGPSVKHKQTNNTPAVDRVEELSVNENDTSRAVSTKDQFSHNTSTFDASSSGEDDSHPSSTNLKTGSLQGQTDARRASGLSDGRNSTQTPPARVESPFSDANEVK